MWNMSDDGRCLSCNNNNNDERESPIVEIPSFSVYISLTVSYFEHIIYHSRSRCTSIHALYYILYVLLEKLATLHGMNWLFILTFAILESTVSVFMCVCDHSCQIARKYNVRWPDRKIIEKHWCKDNNVFWQALFLICINKVPCVKIWTVMIEK